MNLQGLIKEPLCEIDEFYSKIMANNGDYNAPLDQQLSALLQPNTNQVKYIFSKFSSNLVYRSLTYLNYHHILIF